jgi:hypothetical protein
VGFCGEVYWLCVVPSEWLERDPADADEGGCGAGGAYTGQMEMSVAVRA